MAELPDLTVFAQILSRRFKGKTLQEIDVKVTKKLKIPVAELKKALEGRKMDEVVREGKTLQLRFSGRKVLGIHLMLRGELELLDKHSPAPKFEILSFRFSGGEGFAVTDRLRQATPTLDPPVAKAPDALEITKKDFLAVLKKKKGMVKEVLMDQKVMRGIGNSYADEILWEARVSPFSVSSAIPEAIAANLYVTMKAVLKEAINFIARENGDELRGELRDAMKVQRRKNREVTVRGQGAFRYDRWQESILY